MNPSSSFKNFQQFPAILFGFVFWLRPEVWDLNPQPGIETRKRLGIEPKPPALEVQS